MSEWLLASVANAQLWYTVPLIIVISLVYGATRHEFLKEILHHSLKALIWILIFMAVVFFLVWWFSRGL